MVSNEQQTAPIERVRRAGLDREWAIPLAGGLAAALMTGLWMWLLRFGLQVRSVPERMLEWSLLFIPLDVFESALQRFGFSAKVYALDLAVLVALGLLAALGTLALRRRWPLSVLLALGVGLWLSVMLIVMPLTSAGFFALGLLEGTRTTVVGYLAVGLLFSTVLTLVRVYALPSSPEPLRVVVPRAETTTVEVPPRRWALGLMGSSLVMLGVPFLLDAIFPHRTGLPTIVVGDPQEPVPSGGLAQPNPHPNIVAGAASPQPVAAAASPVANAAPSSGLPEPVAVRALQRDQDGAVLPSGRRPGELSDPVTSNDNFYIVTKNAGGDPVLHPDDWRLVVDGEVERPFELDYATLRKLPSVEVVKTLECISNLVDKCDLAPFGCDLISTARWRGVRLSDVLNLSGGVKPAAKYLATISADEYTTALPIDAVLAPDALLVFEMNGQVLPREHGYPARILIPGRYGLKNAKWVVALRPMTRDFLDWYGQRSWSREALVKSMTRIDVPARDARLQPGVQRIAGVAYAGARGVRKVEYSADGGQTWQDAEITDPSPGGDSWVRWQGRFTIASAAELTLRARVTDGTGELQDEPFTLAQPDGGGGWNTISVTGA